MAGEWIKLESSTPNKPEILRMARILKCDRDLVLGKLLRIWAWFDANSVDGRVDGVVSTDVDALVECPGFASAMCTVEWLEVDEGDETLTLPNFGRHNGETAKKRALKNKRQSNWRQNRDTSVVAHVDGGASTDASTREEKRREELKKPPIPPNGGKSSAIGIKAFLADCRSKSEPPIPESDPVFKYASETGIPEDWLHLCWLEFVERNIDSGKRYTDWRRAFRNCVRGNWYKLWWAKPDGEMGLTTTGAMAQKKHREAVNA